MRYYILVSPPDSTPYIAAETFREGSDDGVFRDSSLAAHIEMAHSDVVTRSELLSTEMGRAALAAWEGQDDREADSAALTSDEPERHLRVVRDDVRAEGNG